MCISAPVAHPHDTWRAMREALDALSKNLPWEFQRGGRTISSIRRQIIQEHLSPYTFMRCKIRYQVINGVSLLSQRCKRLSDLIGLCNIICCRELFCKRFRIVLQRLLARLYLFLWPVPPLNIQKPLNRFFIISVSCNLPRIPLNNGIGRNILCNNSA